LQCPDQSPKEFFRARFAVFFVFDHGKQMATIEHSESSEKAPMTIDLKPEQQRVLDLAVQSGAYRNPGEVLDQAFEIIREQLDLEDWMLGQRDEVAAHIAMGFAQAERGELIDGDAAVETLRRRRAERLNPQG
jgi:Arc/MetJ-type ribon-helix-helix transcriptional regulator